VTHSSGCPRRKRSRRPRGTRRRGRHSRRRVPKPARGAFPTAGRPLRSHHRDQKGLCRATSGWPSRQRSCECGQHPIGFPAAHIVHSLQENGGARRAVQRASRQLATEDAILVSSRECTTHFWQHVPRSRTRMGYVSLPTCDRVGRAYARTLRRRGRLIATRCSRTPEVRREEEVRQGGRGAQEARRGRDPNDARTLLKIGDLQAKQGSACDAINTYESVDLEQGRASFGSASTSFLSSATPCRTSSSRRTSGRPRAPCRD